MAKIIKKRKKKFTDETINRDKAEVQMAMYASDRLHKQKMKDFGTESQLPSIEKPDTSGWPEETAKDMEEFELALNMQKQLHEQAREREQAENYTSTQSPQQKPEPGDTYVKNSVISDSYVQGQHINEVVVGDKIIKKIANLDGIDRSRDLVDKITALVKEGKCADARKQIRNAVQSGTDEVFGPKVMEFVLEKCRTYNSSKDYHPKEIGKAIFETYIMELDSAGRKEDAEYARRWRFYDLKEN